jgi:glycosyltransferase involved in cell wall biosynthesis
MNISICINTKNRPELLVKCLNSIRRAVHITYEILVIDQSDDQYIQKNVFSSHAYHARYFRIPQKGVGYAKNKAIERAKGTIIAFTDDDCIVSSLWVKTIQYAFDSHKEVSAVFGKTLPYQKTKHPGKTCPCIFLRTHPKLFSRPAIHSKQWGFGNNMAIRKSKLHELGGFKTWLGPGSIGSNAEDAEIALRLLHTTNTIYYEPKMVVFHNKWLNSEEMKKQQLSYIRGEMACYIYYALFGYDFARAVIAGNLIESFNDIKRTCGDLLKRRTVTPKEWNYTLSKTWTRLIGLSIGSVFFMKENMFGSKDTSLIGNTL